MRIFDTIYNSFDIGPGFNNRELQTKAFNSFMGYFWLDPLGKLYEIDYTHTHDFIEDADPSNPSLKYTWISSGNRGKIKPVYHNGSITVCPVKWNAHYAPFPECKLLFRNGIVEVLSYIDKK